MARTELPNGVILPAEYSDDWYEDMTSNLTKLDDVIGSDSEKLNADGVYFLRMSSAALTDGGTGNFSDLNSSYKIKTGDLVLDSGRKLYQVVSVDSTNETFTVGNSLFKVTAESDLAPVAESGDYDDLDNKPDLNPYDQHLADTDIHVTTADKNRWNNNTYVFRYSSTALTASSTNSNTLLDNTDNLKVGDKVIDSSGVLFSITAIDTANSTFSIGTALIDLAQDSDVVHKSGNETVSGVKTITDSSLDFKSTSAEYGVSPGDSSVIFRDKNNLQTFKIYHRVFSSGLDNNLASFFITQKVDNTYYTSNGIQLFANTGNKNVSLRPILANSNTDGLSVSLGVSDRRWSDVQTYKVNGLEPSSLSLPSGNLNDVIDISSYLTYLEGTNNTYVAPANGWISITLSNCSGIQAYINGLWGNQLVRPSAGAIRFLMPILKNLTVNILIFGGNIDNARFIPCQGNI